MRVPVGQSDLRSQQSCQVAMGYYRCIVVKLDLHERNAVVSTIIVGM
jgi:hypothetical protein